MKTGPIPKQPVWAPNRCSPMADLARTKPTLLCRLPERPPTSLAPSARLGCTATLLIAYMQQRCLTRTPVDRLGFSSSRRWFGRVVSKRQHYRVAGPAILVDYLLDDTGDVRGSLLGTLGMHGHPLRYIPHHLRRRCRPAANVTCS